MRARRIVGAWLALPLLVNVLAGCAGGMPSAPAGSARASDEASVTLSIAVPRPAASAATHVRAAYVASTTASIAVTVDTLAGQSVFQQTYGVTPTSSGCSTTNSVTTCIEAFAIPPGSYIASVATYDSAGKVLSQAQQVSFSAQLGAANAIPLTLYGVPHAIVVSSAAQTVRGSQAGGFTLYGSQAQPFTIETTDADGNTIVGPGLPTWNVASAGGSGITITQPAAGSNVFELTPTGNVSGTFNVTANFSDATVCEQTGAVCSASLSATRKQVVFYCLNADLYQLAPPYTASTIVTNASCDDVTTWLDRDSFGDVFLLNTGTLRVFEPPYASAAATVSGLPSTNAEIAVDAFGNVFECSENAYGYEIAPPYISATELSGIYNTGTYPNVRMDGSTLLVSGNAVINLFASPYSANTGQLADGPNSIAREAVSVSTTGEIGVATSEAVVYPSPTSSPIVMQPGSTPLQSAFDGSGNFYVSSGAGIDEFSPPFSTTSTPSRSFIVAPGTVERLQFDEGGDAFIATSNGLYEVLSGTTAARLITNGTIYSMTITP